MAVLRSLLVVGVAAAIVLVGEALVIGAALSGGDWAEIVTYLSASALMALWVVACGSSATLSGRRFIEAVSCGLIAPPVASSPGRSSPALSS